MSNLFLNKLSAQVRSSRKTYRRFELFQYTACRSLALDRCKFVSTSVMRLRENVARAIIPLVPVQPRFPLRPRLCPR